jgi:3-hydroxyacyl-[acyl-carrier protein] dehydratase/trans-2-decenoyl-[acyl-carrier protein] isomerase
LGVDQVKFTGQVLPSAKLLTYEIDVRRVMRGKLALVIADGSMAVDGRPIYAATGLRVGLFQSTEGF